MKKVTKIAPNIVYHCELHKLRVAAYCRVSTDNDEQLVSLEAQIKHYESYINANPDWEFAGLYYDEGITGTKKEKRPELLRMIADCENRKIDFIVTKSISWFARNTTDCLELVRKLIDLGVFIYFEKENINTGSMESELMLSILSGLAESESVSIAENNKWSIQKRFQNGTYKTSCSPFGYDAVDGELIVNEHQAEIVRFIFAEILSGISLHKIADELNRRIIPSKKGGRWTSTTIRGMVWNEKYIGDALLQKTYTVDFLTKKRVKNNGFVPQYYVENSHEAIIPREIFMQVQEELIRRRIVHTSPNGKNRTFSSIHCFSNMIICGGCGEFYRRIHWNNRGKKSVVWRCISRLENTGLFCDARTVPESTIEQVLVSAINKTLCGKDSFLATLQNNIETVLCHSNDQALAGIDERLQELQAELLKLASSKADYEHVADEIYRLREEKQKIQLESAGRDELKNRITDMGNFLKGQPTAITEYDEPLVRRLIERLTVYEEKFTVEFKSGVMLDVVAQK